jgi:chromosome segregation ATPase
VINELEMKIKNSKEKVTQVTENLRKKNQAESQNTVESHSSRLEHVEDRISELKDKTEIKEKTEEMLVRQLKGCERNMQELTDSIKS